MPLNKSFFITLFLTLLAASPAPAQSGSLGAEGHWYLPCQVSSADLVDGLGQLYFTIAIRAEEGEFLMDRRIYQDPSCQQPHPLLPDMPIAGGYTLLPPSKELIAGQERAVIPYQINARLLQNSLQIYGDVNPASPAQPFTIYVDHSQSGDLFIPLAGDLGEMLLGRPLAGQYLAFSRSDRDRVREIDEIFPNPAQPTQGGQIIPNAQNSVTPTSCKFFGKDREQGSSFYMGCQENVNFPADQFALICDLPSQEVEEDSSGIIVTELNETACPEHGSQPFCLFGHNIYGADMKAYAPLFTEISCAEIYGQWRLHEDPPRSLQ